MIIKQRDLDEALEYCVGKVHFLGYKTIPVQKICFSKSKGYLARYRHRFSLDSDGNIVKEDSSIFVNKEVSGENTNFTIQDLRTLVMHEVIHTIITDQKTKVGNQFVDSGLSHGNKWNEIARRVMKHFPEYDLFYDKNIDEILDFDKPVKFIYICPSCGNRTSSRRDSLSFFGTGDRCPLCSAKWEKILPRGQQ